VIFEYCIEKNYITITKELEHSLCRELIRINITDTNILIILWLIENFISTEKLNEFRFDYDNDKDYTEPITNKEYPRRYFSLLQPFYNNQFYDTTIYIPQIFHVFKQKKFDFAKVSESCCISVISSAISNWDLYSVRVMYEEGCEFDEECYTNIMCIIRRSLCRMRNEIDDTNFPKEYNDGSWSHVEKLLYEKIYWYLDEMSCVLVKRNSLWFENALPIIKNAWDIVEKERDDGYEHRAPQKKRKISAAPVTISTDSMGEKQYIMPLLNKSVCLIKLDENGNVV
jgi:hypothetical protein